jgi:hypothetical protein
MLSIPTPPCRFSRSQSGQFDALPVSCRSLAGQGDGDTFAQVVWQVICVVVQFMVHEVLAVELAPVIVVVDVVDDVEPLDELDGTKQALWQVAACALHSIMQFVSVELCARRIFPSADAPPAKVSIANKASIAKTANTTANHRMTASTGRQ